VGLRAKSEARVIGRYALHDEIAAGGVATVHLGRLLGQAGFSRTVAIKRLHAQFAKDPDFVAMFLDEARLAARIHHPNVVSTLDVVARQGELFVVMEYIPGEALSKLARCAAESGTWMEPRIAVAIVVGFLHGLHAAHEARNESGEPLELVHRDVSPQNVLVGIDGVARVVDFGVAKAVGRVQTTREGQLKGKLPYMSPEQIQGLHVTRRTDVYAAAVVLWELLARRRLFSRENDAAVMMSVLNADVPAPSTIVPGLPWSLDRIALRGLARNPEARFATAREMALALEQAIDLALPSEVGAWVQATAASILGARASLVSDIESHVGVDRQLRSSAPPSAPIESGAALSGALESSGALSGALESSAPGADARTMMTSATPGEEGSPARSKRKGITVALALALCVALIALFARFVTPGRVGHVAASSASVGGVAGELPDTSVRAEPPAVAPPVVASAPAPVEQASARPAPAPVAAPSAAPSATSAGTSAAPRQAPAKRAAPAKCDPPYRVDPSGRKIFKLECL
jgi:serine/threonine protein kinase